MLFYPPPSLTLIEPGPVITEFERKVYEEGLKMDLSAADKETANMFTNIYLKNYNQIFQSLGQSPEDIAEHTHKIITTDNPSPDEQDVHPHDHPQVRRSQRRPAHRHLLQNDVRARQNLQRQPQLNQNAALGEPQELQPGEASAVKTRGLHQRTPGPPLQRLLTLLPCVRPVHPSTLY
ncbi:Retinol dehydrogenase 8 [Acipenser ruthenus]|uniref:Retinol dehydrogenase 8 n=1 Tax=Acipenser ruthenus TaxID=7906 RepID=A0A444U3R3_ACIRT|nr:Retinol dehydrogenase 8 [Acipenser ruthenus]